MEYDKLTQIIAKILCVDPFEITEDTTFGEDLGADSLDVYQMVIELEEVYGICIVYEEIKNIKTVGEAVNYLKKSVMDKGSNS